MITQDFLPAHWNWTPQELAILQTEDAKATAEIIKGRLESHGVKVAACYAIKHNEDQKELWDEYNCQYISCMATNHIHIVFKFADNSGKQLDEIAEIVGIAPQFVEKPRTGRYAYDNMLSYLIHIKYPDKYQYKAAEVVTLAGRDYMNISRERHKAWMDGRYQKASRNLAKTYKQLKHRISTEPNFNLDDILSDPAYRQCYILHRHTIDEYLNTWNFITNRQNGTMPSWYYIGKKSGKESGK
jgi:hypothetical protein